MKVNLENKTFDKLNFGETFLQDGEVWIKVDAECFNAVSLSKICYRKKSDGDVVTPIVGRFMSCVPYSEIEIGDTFSIGGSQYMKIDNRSDGNCISLKNGKMGHCYGSDLVLPVEVVWK